MNSEFNQIIFSPAPAHHEGFLYSSPSYRGCALLILYHLQTLPAHYVLIFQNVCKDVERSRNSQHPGLCVYVHLSTERFSYHLYSKFGAGSESSSRGSSHLGQPHFNLTEAGMALYNPDFIPGGGGFGVEAMPNQMLTRTSWGMMDYPASDLILVPPLAAVGR